MNIAGTTYSLNEKAFDVFLSGCNPPHCKGCHNPETWDFNAGEPLDKLKLGKKILEHETLIDRVRIMGGEPLDQDAGELFDLLGFLMGFFPNIEIWIFTKYLPEDITKKYEEIYKYADYIKFGRYNSAFPPIKDHLTGITLGSGNQYVLRCPV